MGLVLTGLPGFARYVALLIRAPLKAVPEDAEFTATVPLPSSNLIKT